MFFFKKREFGYGLLEDPRRPEERSKDYQTAELFGTEEVSFIDFEVWKDLPANKDFLSKLPVYNQNGSSACVAYSLALIATINNLKEEGRALRYSPRGIYARRQNKPTPGMWFQNGAELFRDYGVVFEELLPSNGLNEEAMNKLDDYLPSFDLVGKIYGAKNYFWLRTFDEVVSVLAKGFPVQIGVRFNKGEWGKLLVPQTQTQATSIYDLAYGHSIVALPYSYFNYQSKRAVLVQDSWGEGIGWNGRRILTEDWFASPYRFQGGLWYEDLANLQVFNEIKATAQLPKYQWTRNLTIGDTGEDVRMLQLALGMIQGKDGTYLFPLMTRTPTGYFGGLTRSAIKGFQELNNLPITGIFDDLTRKTLNSLTK
jgi:peptidoglycan hydrolase-like protein with peptidoglycan-binding domain